MDASVFWKAFIKERINFSRIADKEEIMLSIVVRLLFQQNKILLTWQVWAYQ